MKFLIRLFIPVVFLLFLVQSVFAQTFPRPVGFVNDFARLYSEPFTQRLENQLRQVEASSSAEISVVTVSELQGTTIDDYASRLFEDWKIGKDKKDNGVLVLISKLEREVRIEVGYGLEPVITDARAGRIIREYMIPAFKENNYERGTQSAVDVLTRYIRGEVVIEEKKAPDVSGWLDFIPFLFFGLIYVGSFMARTKEIVAGGVLGGILGVILGLIIGSLTAVLISGFILTLIGLFLDYILSKNYQRLRSQNKSTDWWGSRGGFYGGGGSSGGGFGGFGGGSSGGGGASGHW